jgi:hypothetical protein
LSLPPFHILSLVLRYSGQHVCCQHRRSCNVFFGPALLNVADWEDGNAEMLAHVLARNPKRK